MAWFCAALLVLLGGPCLAAAATPPSEIQLWQGARLTPVLTPAALASLPVRLTLQFEVIKGGQVIALTADGALVDLTARRMLPAKAPLGITSLTADGGLPIAVRGRRLGWYDGGTVPEKIQLPQDGLMVAAGPKQRLYLYGPQGAGSVIYLLEQGRVAKLLELSDGRISTLAVIGERLFFAAGNTIYAAAEGQRPAIVFVASGHPEIRSIAADPLAGLVYFAAGDAVYAMRAGMAVSVLRGLEGSLRYAGDALYVLDPWRGWLVALRGLERLLEAGADPAGAEVPSGQFKE